jgi:hypothetical protein
MPQEVPDAVELQVETKTVRATRLPRPAERKMACYSAMDAAGLGHRFGPGAARRS